MRKALVVVLVIFAVLTIAFPKTEKIKATTDFGERVILYDDGTWEYFTVTSTSTCPIKILNAYITKGEFIAKELHVIVENTSTKTIRAYKLRAIFYDDFGEVVDTINLVAQEKSIKPGEVDGYYSYWKVYETLATHVELWVSIVIFSDGTRWFTDEANADKYYF